MLDVQIFAHNFVFSETTRSAFISDIGIFFLNFTKKNLENNLLLKNCLYIWICLDGNNSKLEVVPFRE